MSRRLCLKFTAVSIIVNCFLVASAVHAETSPAWMQAAIPAITRPTHLTEGEQAECTQTILTEINHHFHTDFSLDDVQTVQMADWEHEELGFVRGGGYNIRLVKTVNGKDPTYKKFKPGRFSDLKSDAEMGGQPSLHIPDVIDGKKMFNKQIDAENGTIHYDLIAHSDSAFAFLPVGVFMHLFEDVLGAKRRRPCPIERGIEE